MTLSIEELGLTDIPFMDIGSLDPSSKDPRENGRIFERKKARPLVDRILGRMEFGETATYVSSRESIKGTGKSALMAAAYWRLHDDGKPAVWANALGSYTATATIGRIFDAVISEGFLAAIQKRLGQVTHERLYEIVEESYNKPSRALVDGLFKVLSQDEWQMTYKLANIKRSLLVFSPRDVFGYFLAILQYVKIKRMYIFLDQFEDYIQAHQGSQALQRLSDDWRSMLEMFRGKASMAITTHPQAEQIIKGLPNYRLAPITDESRVIVEPLSTDEGVELTRAYLSEFRVRNFKSNELAPFDRKSISFLSTQTRGNPRALIGALRTALRIAAEQEVTLVDYEFVSSPRLRSAMVVASTP